jgi:hypothetical protein
LRDRLEAGLSTTEHKDGEPSVAEVAERIKSLRSANTIEVAPQRTGKTRSAEEPETARIRRRSEEGWQVRMAGRPERKTGIG